MPEKDEPRGGQEGKRNFEKAWRKKANTGRVKDPRRMKQRENIQGWANEVDRSWNKHSKKCEWPRARRLQKNLSFSMTRRAGTPNKK
jgi:hypothetical protein